MPHTQPGLVARPVSIEVRINGRPIELDLPSAPWRHLLNEVALGAAPAIMEQALEIGGRQDAVIEVWDASGGLLLALSLRVQADWQRRAATEQRIGPDEPLPEASRADAPARRAIGQALAYLPGGNPGGSPGGNMVEIRAGT